MIQVFLLYIFFHWSFYVNGLVRHHEAFAEISLGPGAHLRGGVLDFTNDEASSIPVRQIKERRHCLYKKTDNMKATQKWSLNMLIAPVVGCSMGHTSFLLNDFRQNISQIKISKLFPKMVCDILCSFYQQSLRKIRPRVKACSLLFNLLIWVVPFIGKVSFHLKVNATSLKFKC